MSSSNRVMVDGEDSSEEDDVGAFAARTSSSSMHSSDIGSSEATSSTAAASSATTSNTSASAAGSASSYGSYDVEAFSPQPSGILNACVQQAVLPEAQYQLRLLRQLAQDHEDLLSCVNRERRSLGQFVGVELQAAQDVLRQVPQYEGKIKMMMQKMVQLNGILAELESGSDTILKEVSAGVNVRVRARSGRLRRVYQALCVGGVNDPGVRVVEFTLCFASCRHSGKFGRQKTIFLLRSQWGSLQP